MQREHVMSQYKEQTRNKQYHWIKSSVRKSIRLFFTEIYEVPDDFYSQHEAIFMFLVLKEPDLKAKYGLKQVDARFIEKMRLTYGKQPTLTNMRDFFKHPVIKALWVGEFGSSRGIAF